MKISLFAAFVSLAAALPNARQVGNLNNPDRIPGEFLVVLHAPAGRVTNKQYASDVIARIATISLKISIINAFTNLRAPILHVKTSDEAVMSQLFQIDEVDTIEADSYQHMIEQCSSQSSGSRIWGLSRISSLSVPPSYAGAQYSYQSNNGAGVRLYVLDTSVRLTHEDFSERGTFGANFIGGDDGDNNGHGTHCAGTAAGTEFGVSKGATVVAVKVLNDGGSGAWNGIIAGIDWSVKDAQDRGVRGVVSLSVSGLGNSATDSAVKSAYDAGLPVVAAAGNNNGNACSYSPARTQEVITVGATDIEEDLSSFSNWGGCVDILAPGSSILSASHLSDTATATFSGTSMACPHVAGAAAAFLSDNPTATPAEVKSYLTGGATQNAINLRGTSGTPNLLQYSSCA